MAKKTPRKKLIEKLDKIFSIYIRRRNAVNDVAECFTCGKKDHWKKLQNGHFQSRKHYSTKWHESEAAQTHDDKMNAIDTAIGSIEDAMDELSTAFDLEDLF